MSPSALHTQRFDPVGIPANTSPSSPQPGVRSDFPELLMRNTYEDVYLAIID